MKSWTLRNTQRGTEWNLFPEHPVLSEVCWSPHFRVAPSAKHIQMFLGLWRTAGIVCILWTSDHLCTPSGLFGEPTNLLQGRALLTVVKSEQWSYRGCSCIARSGLYKCLAGRSFKIPQQPSARRSHWSLVIAPRISGRVTNTSFDKRLGGGARPGTLVSRSWHGAISLPKVDGCQHRLGHMLRANSIQRQGR